MANPRVTGVGSVDLGVADLGGSARFYTEVWGLKTVASTERSVYLCGSGPEHHIYALHARPRTEVLRVNLTAPNRDVVDALHARVAANGPPGIEAPGDTAEPGGGYGFAFKDCENRTLRILCDQIEQPRRAPDADQPSKISHVVLNTPDRHAVADYYRQTLGMRVIDQTKLMTFLCAGSDHHCIAIADNPVVTLNHVAFETESIDAVMRGAGRMRRHGVQIEWGVGRHGPGNNVFAYFLGPGGEMIEYTAEVHQVDESYVPKGPADWVWPPGRMDQWGVAPPPSENFRKAQGRVFFAAEMFRPG